MKLPVLLCLGLSCLARAGYPGPQRRIGIPVGYRAIALVRDAAELRRFSPRQRVDVYAETGKGFLAAYPEAVGKADDGRVLLVRNAVIVAVRPPVGSASVGTLQLACPFKKLQFIVLALDTEIPVTLAPRRPKR